MLKKLLLVALIAIIGISTAVAQFNKAERKFMLPPFKLKLVDENVTTIRVDGNPYLYGLPLMKDYDSKFSTESDSPNRIVTTAINAGKQNVLDYPSNNSPRQIWQDPLEPDNIHTVTMYNSNGGNKVVDVN